jgi:phosphatidylglycerol---prolipoprotein diacylglyceryl transferase
MVVGLVVFLIARHFVPKPLALQQLPWRKRLLLALSAFVGGTIGAKLPFVPSSPGGWLAPESWFSDGKTITMGLIGGYVAVELAKLALGIHVKTGDTYALPLALAMAIGRLGCFFNGCCYGTPTDLPWAVAFQVRGQSLLCHPTQIYESLFHLGMAAFLLLAMRFDVLSGNRLKFYLIAYAGYRFLTEFIRPENPDWLGLTYYQCVAIAMASGLALQWAFESPRGKLEPGTLSDSAATDLRPLPSDTLRPRCSPF